MSKLTNSELIQLALEVVNPTEIDDHLVGDVGSALVTDQGNIYTGVCIDAGSSLGFCAERSAIGQMITNREFKVSRIVAVWNNNSDKALHVLPPCGACREFMMQICKDASEIDVVLGSHKTVKLDALMPYHEWPESDNVSYE